MLYVGIDPGKAGAVVAVDMAGNVPMARLTPMLGKEYDEQGMREIVRLLTTGGPVVAALEKVSARPKQGTVSMFSFGAGYGLWRGLLAGMGVSYELVPPRTWQTVVGGTDKSKEACVAAARRLYPNLEITRKKDWGLADAALMAHWLLTRRTNP